MRHVFLRTVLALACTVLSARTSLATDVSGPILSNTTWTLAGSPYIVTGAIIVGGNATLTIDPGVTVKVNTGLGITVGHATWGIGTLRAVGTPVQKITFTSNTLPGQPGQWNSIVLTDRAIDATFDAGGQYVSGSILQHCIVEFAGGGAAGSGAVTITQSSPFVNYCELRNNARSGLYANNSSAPPPLAPPLQVKNSYIHHNNSGDTQTGGGAYLRTTGLAFSGNTVSNNTISGNSSGTAGAGLYASMDGTNSTFVITGNTISNNTSSAGCNCGGSGGGLYASMFGTSSTFAITGNTISNNTCNPYRQSSGGGLYASMSGNSNTFAITGNTIANNTSSSTNLNDSYGGGLYADVQGVLVTIQNNNIFGNLAEKGGGLSIFVYSGGAATLLGNTIASNQARGYGSGIGRGGGAYFTGFSSGSNVITLNSNSITRNEAHGGPTGGSGLGGGLFVTESVGETTTTVTLAGNQVTGTFNVLSGNTADLGTAIYSDMLANDNGSNDIRAEYVCWGGLDPSHAANPNLIYDYFDNTQKAFVFYPPHVTSPNCTPATTCGPGLIADCNGHCAPISWISDPLCDNGFYTYGGYPVSFNCQQFGNDGGACNAPPPAITLPPNHGVPVPPPAYVPPPPPVAAQTKLVFITHGFNTSDAGYTGFWTPFANAIQQRLASNPEWVVRLYDWRSESRTGVPWMDIALDNARVLGAGEGSWIASRHYAFVHLIAHSAGSGMIAVIAKKIKDAHPDTIVHTTFLDAYAGLLPEFTDYRDGYGGHSDWSDYYYSREHSTLDLHCSAYHGVPLTGDFTQQSLPNSFSVDVTRADPLSTDECLSTHSWPNCFYASSMGGALIGGCLSPSTSGYGFPLSYESVGGNLASWLANVTTTYGHTTATLGGSPVPSSSRLLAQSDPSINLAMTANYASAAAAVQTTPTVLTMATQPSGAIDNVPAWINYQITTTAPRNFVCFDATLGGTTGAAGILSVHVDGTRVGLIDQTHASAGTQHYAFATGPDLAPGQHMLSFRLDPGTAAASTVMVESVATGVRQLQATCRPDFNGVGGVTVQDVFDFLSAWFSTLPSADFNGVGGVTVQDVFDFLDAWFQGC